MSTKIFHNFPVHPHLPSWLSYFCGYHFISYFCGYHFISQTMNLKNLGISFDVISHLPMSTPSAFLNVIPSQLHFSDSSFKMFYILLLVSALRWCQALQPNDIYHLYQTSNKIFPVMICLVPDAKIEEHFVLLFSEILIGFLVLSSE